MMNETGLLMGLCYVLSLVHFLYGYKEAIRITNEEGLVSGWSMVFSFPLAIIFAYFANYFHLSMQP
ncbi:hypothetical protein [Metabacillus arenae]|uniref:Uncharacterized protein n=1 Tax=Metabacillus arenae TaxID=2771434 RepID=A0A926NHU0_9BACI|nr:hypothetical protein [Metabacillus arenae]MBD1381581.1 hypothetical protein [Metabacillus arenae]